MSRDRGVRLQNELAAYLRDHGWPSAESAGSGRNGTDVTGTPGIVWENKAADQFSPLAFVRQAQAHTCHVGGVSHPADSALCPLPVVVYWPRGVGAKSAEHTLAIIPLGRLATLLKEAGYQ